MTAARRLRQVELTRPGSGLADDPAPSAKTVVYEIMGPPGAVATVNYLNLDAEPQIARDVTLPWTLTLTTTAPAAVANIVAQGDSDTIGCRITVDGVVKDERWSNGVSAQTFCIVSPDDQPRQSASSGRRGCGGAGYRTRLAHWIRWLSAPTSWAGGAGGVFQRSQSRRSGGRPGAVRSDGGRRRRRPSR